MNKSEETKETKKREPRVMIPCIECGKYFDRDSEEMSLNYDLNSTDCFCTNCIDIVKAKYKATKARDRYARKLMDQGRDVRLVIIENGEVVKFYEPRKKGKAKILPFPTG